MPHTIIDNAPTAAMLVHSKLPRARTGQPIVEGLSPAGAAGRPGLPELGRHVFLKHKLLIVNMILLLLTKMRG
ncbi:hypothetical protein QMK33_10405 [Hymenobacter sp. H14-R3]|uniref:hypothetical protein n=1 Tax=Hymenobacter sp. H14-R3 TaxID=3046308 RepID=UPI0024BA4F99|nr:hypothetical protein [Hymenobacter sp. H14-R3]MDJ0365567.1 hypothetical protein [Hymenobacter sp. H14-R3]